MQAIMTNPDDIPTLPAELAELVLLHLPAALIATDPHGMQALGIKRFWWWANCIIPSGLPFSSIRAAARKFTNAQDIGAWEPFAKGKVKHPTAFYLATLVWTAEAIIDIATAWHRMIRCDEHMYTLFDSALIHNRLDVMDLWAKSSKVLPQRTGMDPQTPMPLRKALILRSFGVVGWIYRHARPKYSRQHDAAIGEFAVELCRMRDSMAVKTLINCLGGLDTFRDIVGLDVIDDMGEEAFDRNMHGLARFLWSI